MPIGRLIRKIQCHEALVDQRATEDGAEDRAEQHRDAEHGHHATDPLRTGGPGQDRHAERHQHAAAETLQDAEEDQHLERGRRRAEHGAGGEERDREEVEALRAEPVRGPAGQRDHAGEGQRVGGHRPGDLGGRGVELFLEGVQRDGDDGDVEDRHDRPQDDHAGHHQDALVELVGVLRLGGAGLGLGVGHPPTVLVASDNGVIVFAVACVTLTGGGASGQRVRRPGPRSGPGSDRARTAGPAAPPPRRASRAGCCGR